MNINQHKLPRHATTSPSAYMIDDTSEYLSKCFVLNYNLNLLLVLLKFKLVYKLQFEFEFAVSVIEIQIGI